MELLIRVRNHNLPDGSIATERMGIGDIIAICENDHPWTQREIDNPDWRILKLPRFPARVFAKLLEKTTIEEDALIEAGELTRESFANRKRAYRFKILKLLQILKGDSRRLQLNDNFTIQYAIDQGIIEKVI